MRPVTPNPPVTWLMAVKDGMPYLPETLQSIAAQTYPHHSLLVWDNGSTDGTLEELERWIPHRIPGTVFRDRPLGLGASLAALVEAADTEYCARIDADDVNCPDRLERQVRFLNAHPEVGVLGGQVIMIDENGQTVPSRDGDYYQTDDASIHWGALWKPDIWHPTVMFRRSLVLQVGNYRDWRPVEDHDLWRRMSMICYLANLPEVVVRRRTHAASITMQVGDFRPQHEQLLQKTAGLLFPGLSREEALYLWDLVYYDDAPKPIRLADLRLHRRAAVLLARALGRPDGYFLHNVYYRGQRYHLRRQWLEQHGLGWLIGLKPRLRRLLRGGGLRHTSTSPGAVA